MKLKLFFSHAWADKAGAKVKKLLLLVQNNYEVWLDKKQIDIGNHINDIVAKGIEDCDIFICVWSRNAYDSKGVLFELETASKLNKPILILKIEDFDTAHSPFLAGKEYIDFSGDDVTFKQQEIYLENFLLRKKIELFEQHFSSPGDKATLDELAKKSESLQDVLIELEDTIKRQQLKVSGNDASDVYIQSSLNAFEKTLDDDEEGKLMMVFSAKMKAISQQYPLKQDDSLKKQLAIKAIEETDPAGKNKNLAELKTALEQEMGLKKNELTQSPTVSSQQLQKEEELLTAFKNSVEKTRQVVLDRSKSAFEAIPVLNFLSPVNKASLEFEMSYITGSPVILEKMYAIALQSPNRELRMLLAVLIQHLDKDALQKAEDTKQIKSYMPYAYLINNTARLLVQAKALSANDISYSLVSSTGLDKLSKFFFKEDWKEKAEKFLDMIKTNYGIEDKNLNWIKVAATVIGVALVGDGIAALGTTAGNNDVSTTGNKPVYFEDKMASMGISMPNTVQY